MAKAPQSLSKSRLLSFRQCPKRLWLEVHKPELRDDSLTVEARFKVGHEVGAVARRIYDPQSKGMIVDARSEGFAATFQRSAKLLETFQPVLEAGFSANGVLAFADVMLPVRKGSQLNWRMVEVKSSTSVKDYHREDVAIQSFVTRSAGVPLSSISVAYIDSKWSYPGDDDYEGLLTEEDLTKEAQAREADVKGWIKEALDVAAKPKEPVRRTGSHCSTPFECGFSDYCRAQEPQARHPVEVLPRITKAIRAFVGDREAVELGDVPDALLNELQLRVKRHTLSGEAYLDAKGAAATLAQYKLPAFFLDFETVSFAVPIWKGTRPYQQIPFQFSLHRISRTGSLDHKSFLDLTGQDPSRDFANALVAACDGTQPVFVYNATFEKSRIDELATRFPALQRALTGIKERIVDLLPVAQRNYYHPSQKGSWSLKAVLPGVAPDLSHAALDGIQDGGMANRKLSAASSSRSCVGIDTPDNLSR